MKTTVGIFADLHAPTAVVNQVGGQQQLLTKQAHGFQRE
jgi:hypothetical protein